MSGKKKTKHQKAKSKKQRVKLLDHTAENSTLQGLIIFAFGTVLFLSMASFGMSSATRNSLGGVGDLIGMAFTALFGISSYFLCAFIGWMGWRLIFHKPINKLLAKSFNMLLFILSFSMLLTLIEHRFPTFGDIIGYTFFSALWANHLYYHLGGAPTYYFYHDLPTLNLFRVFNSAGIFIIFTTTLLASAFYLLKIKPRIFLDLVGDVFKEWREKRSQEPVPIKVETKTEPNIDVESSFMRFVKLRSGNTQSDQLAIEPRIDLTQRPSISQKDKITKNEPFTAHQLDDEEHPLVPAAVKEPLIAPVQMPQAAVIKPIMPAAPTPPAQKRENALAAQKVYNGDFTKYKLPPVVDLTEPKVVDQPTLRRDLKRQAEVLEETLHSFAIDAKVGQINCGPTITSFEVHPSIGVKVQRIKALENDIALNMEAKSIRIIAPIPGKAAVGIEVPNPQPQEVSFKEMLKAYQKSGRKFHIPILLGKAVNGDHVMSDLTKMPHLIIAGATGSGKSVCVNTIVMSILMTARPDEIKMIMVDPKKVELTPYTHLPHMLAPVITEPQGACAALKWLVKEMESRYELFKQVGMRNIESFNTRTIDKEKEENLQREIPKHLPYIVCIIDELADLMMVAQSDIETPIARIAQMARAVGIHLILATQRPSREVITGLIKANFPTRISFKVSSRVNSSIVLDEIGAESLLGNGDMLFLPPGSSTLIRAQGAFIRDDDINKTVKFVCDQAPTNYVIESFDYYVGDGGGPFEQEPADSMYGQALDVILNTGNASTTFLQRKLKIGYARAASIIDEMEQRGVLGPAEGSKPRKILMSRGQIESDQDLFD